MLTAVLARDRVTVDCDIIHYYPDTSYVAVESLAKAIGQERGLPEMWFNSSISLRTDLIPDRWQDRRILIERGDFLSVDAISRVDLIAMKFFARRPQDLEDLDSLRVRTDDIEFVWSYLLALPAKGTPQSEIDEAAEIVRAWPTQT